MYYIKCRNLGDWLLASGPKKRRKHAKTGSKSKDKRRKTLLRNSSFRRFRFFQVWYRYTKTQMKVHICLYFNPASGYRPDRPSNDDTTNFFSHEQRPLYDNSYDHVFNKEPAYGTGHSPIHNEIDETNNYNNPSRRL